MFIQSPYRFNETVNKTREYLIDKVIVVKTTSAKACREYGVSVQPNRGETKALKYPQRNQKKKKKPDKDINAAKDSSFENKTNHGSSCLGLDVESFFSQGIWQEVWLGIVLTWDLILYSFKSNKTTV